MDQLINILTNPWFWALFIPILFLEKFLVYIRKFYSKETQEKIDQCEVKQKSLSEDTDAKRAKRKVMFLMFSTPIVFTFLCVGFKSLFFDDVCILPHQES